MHVVRWGAVWALLGVALGAFGTHVLREVLEPARLATFETGVRYQLYHALGAIAIGALDNRTHRAAWLLLLGSLIFSGSLYALALTGVGGFGAIAPFGGGLMIAGWGLLAWSFRPALRP